MKVNIRKALPFTIVILAILIITVPMAMLITAKKEALAEKQSTQVGTKKAPTNVVTLELVPQMIQEKISLPGVAKPWVSLKVMSEIRGKVVDKKAMEGREVKTGDILAIIDQSDYQNAVNSAQASWETALSTQKRLKSLVKKNFVTQSQLDDATAGVKTSKAALENAKLSLNRCTIRSPMDGVVDRVYIENGSFLNPADPVCQILQLDTLKIEVGIPESDVAAVRNLSSFEMTIDALGEQNYTGQYHYLYNTSDSMARLYTLEIKVDNPDHLILPDMFARVSIIKQKDPQGLAVPIYSLVDQNKDTGVFVEKDGQVEFRKVTKGFQDGWNTQIADGLFPGENVVVIGHRIIEDGEKINVTQTIRDMGELYR